MKPSKYNDNLKKMQAFIDLLDKSDTKAQFSIYSTINGQSEFLTSSFVDGLMNMFTNSNHLGKDMLKIFIKLKSRVDKLNAFYGDGKILLQNDD